MHQKFPSLEQFNKIFARETYDADGAPARRTLVYHPKIKLHGTGMAVRVETGACVIPQCRNNDLTLANDLDGFAAFVEPDKELWCTVASDEIITFYGEWAGPGILKGQAVQMTDTPRFYIFALGIGEVARCEDRGLMTSRLMITDPEAIAAYLPQGLNRDRVRVLPYERHPFNFDFSDETSVECTLAELNAFVDAVADCDPYIARAFGIEKGGEGYVLMPHATAAEPITSEVFSRTTFKAKIAKHRVQKQAKPASVREPLPQDATALVEAFCTPQRIAQAIDEVCKGVPDIKATGRVIGWVCTDILKEAACEIDALGIGFDRLKGEIAICTRAHFMAQLPSA